MEWIPDKSVRNEPLDLAVLCRAAAAICGMDSFSEAYWASLGGGAQPETPRAHQPAKDDFWGSRGRGSFGGGKEWFK